MICVINDIMTETPKKVPLYSPIKKALRCGVCERRCVISDGETGYCGLRVNIKGVLYTKSYGMLSAIESRPMEIKPFYHFMPGKTALTFSTWSCNLSCPWCQNHHLSMAKIPKDAPFVSPENLVNMAINAGDIALCASFNEPTMLFEYCLDVFSLAKKRGLLCTMVSNGYMTLDALRMLVNAGLDAINVDVKGDDEVYRRYCGGANVGVVWRNIREAINLGVHVEVIYLVIPGVNDAEDVVCEILENHMKYAGASTPLHINRYFPAYKFSAPPTPISTLECIYKRAKDYGIKYAYIGNVPGHYAMNTYCPSCNALIIERAYGRVIIHADGDACPNCGEKLGIVFYE